MNKQENRLKNYLECESLLREFFKNLTFCRDNCFTQESSMFIKEIPGNIGCCLVDHHYDEYLINRLLIIERIKKYGPPKDKNFCGYHTEENGCILEDHKPIICISYICSPQREYLKTNFEIDNFNYKKILEEILEGDITILELNEFKSEIKGLIKKVS